MLGQSVRLQPVPIQSLSELERARLQEVAFYHLTERDLHVSISIPTETKKRRKSLRRKFDSFSKEKKEREMAPKAFGIPLSQVIANDRVRKQRQDALRESRRDGLDLEASVLRFRAERWPHHNGGNPPSSSANSSKPLSPDFQESTSRVRRRGGLSVDSISDLVESQSRLLEALQLSHPNELDIKKAAGRTQTRLSLNLIYRQVPRVVERCCSHIEACGLQTVGIFRVGSSKKRVRQLRDEFDLGNDVFLDDEQCVHDVAALLKEFLRDMPDPLLPRELFPAFLHANSLRGEDQLTYLQHLLYLLPPCNCDTLLRLLTLLHTVHSHAQDSIGPDNQEIPGNKMTAGNLAVIFGPNLLQREPGSDKEPISHAVGIEDSATIISITLLLIQNYKQLFTVSAELQQEVLMSLIQTDPDVIDYLLRRKLCSHLTSEADSGGRRDKKASMDSVGHSSEDLSGLGVPPPLFPESQEEGGLHSEVLFNALRLSQSRTRSSADGPGNSVGNIRHFNSHHNLLSLVHAPLQQNRPENRDPQDRPIQDKGSPSAAWTQSSRDIWVRQSSVEEAKPQPTNFWDFFTGRVSGSETIV